MTYLVISPAENSWEKEMLEAWATLFQLLNRVRIKKIFLNRAIFFCEHAGKLYIFVLRGKEFSPIYNPAPLLGPRVGL